MLFMIALIVPYNGPYNKIAAINALLAQMQQGAATVKQPFNHDVMHIIYQF